MKKSKLFKTLALLLFGAVLTLPAMPSNINVMTKAEEETIKVLDLSPSNVNKLTGTSGYQSGSGTIGDLSIGYKNVMGNANYFQINSTSGSGIWNKTTYSDYFISKIEIKVKTNNVNVCVGSDINPTSGTSVSSSDGDKTFTYTQADGYQYFTVLKGSAYSQVSSFKVTFTKNSGEPQPAFVGDYTLVTDASTLKVGDIIVIGEVSSKTAAGSPGSNTYFPTTAATIKDGELSSSSALEFQLYAADTNGKFKLHTEVGFIGVSSDSAKNIAVGNADEWSISVDTDGSATISKDGSYRFLYNVNSPRFGLYNSALSASMVLPQIYKSKTGGEIATYSVTYDTNGGTGEVTDSSTYTAGQTVTVLSASEVTPPAEKQFKEWNTESDGSGTSYLGGSTFIINNNVTLYAIYEEEYIPAGQVYTVVSDASSLKAGDTVLFVRVDGTEVRANGWFESTNKYLTSYEANLSADGELTYTNDKITPMTLVGSTDEWNFSYNDKVLQINSNSNNELKAVSTTTQSFTISIDESNNALITSSYEGQHIYFNSSGNRFSNYKSTTTMSAIKLFKQTGTAKQVVLKNNKLSGLLGSTVDVEIEECISFTPSTLAWSIISGNDCVEFASVTNEDKVTLNLIKEGTAKIQVVADSKYKATAEIEINDYKYNVLLKEDYFISTTNCSGLLGGDLSFVTEFGNPSDMWHFEKAYEGDNTYWLTNGEKYVTFDEDINPDGKNVSVITLTDAKVNVWTVSTGSNDTYMIKTETISRGVRSLAVNENKWYAFEGNNYVGLYETGTFENITVDKLPSKTTYYVGDTFNPLNMKVYANYSNGFKTEITSRITWDVISAGTVATGKVTIAGEERVITVSGLTIYAPISINVEGIKEKYYIGQSINKESLVVTAEYVAVGVEKHEFKTLGKNLFEIAPATIESSTTCVKISLVSDPTIYKEFNISAVENHFVSANYVGEGDVISFGTLGYNPTQGITGGEELTYNSSLNQFYHSTFDYMPYGEQSFEVGKSGGYYTLKNVDTGLYLRGDASTFKAYSHVEEEIIYTDSSSLCYEFDLDVTFESLGTYKVHMKSDANATNFEEDGALTGYSDDYLVYGYSFLSEDAILFTLYDAGGSELADTTVELNWRYEAGAFIYSLKNATVNDPLTDDALWSLHYDEDLEQWDISTKANPDKYCYYNNSGSKFGFYSLQSSGYYGVMIYRDNTKPLPSTPAGISVSFIEGGGTVRRGEVFDWISQLIVTVNYSNGASTKLPVGGYKVVLPDTSKIGKAKGKVIYGQEGHEIEKEFTVSVLGETQAFTIKGAQTPLLVGSTCQLRVDKEIPEDEPLLWESSNELVATVTQTGLVTGIKAGDVTITATSFDGSYSDSVSIKIFQQCESVELNETLVTSFVNETFQLEATVHPDDASNKTVSYSVVSGDAVTVNSSTGLVTCVNEGTAVVRVTTQNKNLTAECTFVVGPAREIPVESITLNKTEATIEVGKTLKLEATVAPQNATNKNLVWSSLDETVAKVNSNGLVTGIGEGTTKIVVKSEDGNVIKTCTISVIKAPVIDPVDEDDDDNKEQENHSQFSFKKLFGCSGSIVASTLIVSFTSLVGAGLLISKKKK